VLDFLHGANGFNGRIRADRRVEVERIGPLLLLLENAYLSKNLPMRAVAGIGAPSNHSKR